MAKITFYRQKRIDGGLRSGISVGDETVLGLFEPGPTDNDPALLWYVDLRCEGARLPTDPKEAREWLLRHEDVIRAGFADCARECSAGIDPDIYPRLWSDFASTPKDIRMVIALSAVRRVDAREISKVLQDIGSHWGHYIRALKPLEHASR